MATGERLKAYPIRMVYQVSKSPEPPSLKLAVSVPKRFHSNAVDRNVLKRRIKEAFTLATADVIETIEKNGLTIDVMLIYTSAEKLDMTGLQPKIILLFERLHTRILNPS